MRYYDEIKAERAIRRRAMMITIFVIGLGLSGMAFVASNNIGEILPESIQELLNIEQPEQPVKKPKKKA